MQIDDALFIIYMVILLNLYYAIHYRGHTSSSVLAIRIMIMTLISALISDQLFPGYWARQGQHHLPQAIRL